MMTKTLPGLSSYLFREDGEVIGLRSGAPLAGGTDKDGYRKFVLIDDSGERRHLRRASLICTAYHGDRPGGMVVRHLDGSRTNDSAINLAWATQADNIADKVVHGTRQIGPLNNRTKLTLDQVAYIRAHPEKTYRGLAQELGVTTGAISGVRGGKTWAWTDGVAGPR